MKADSCVDIDQGSSPDAPRLMSVAYVMASRMLPVRTIARRPGLRENDGGFAGGTERFNTGQSYRHSPECQIYRRGRLGDFPYFHKAGH